MEFTLIKMCSRWELSCGKVLEGSRFPFCESKIVRAFFRKRCYLSTRLYGIFSKDPSVKPGVLLHYDGQSKSFRNCGIAL